MPAVTLAKPEIGLFVDYENTRIQLPRLDGDFDYGFDVALVGPFDGDLYPIPFSGEGEARSHDLTVLYSRDEHTQMRDLIALFRLAHRSADRRLMLRPNAFTAAGLDQVEVVVVADVKGKYLGGRAWSVSFTATRVASHLDT